MPALPSALRQSPQWCCEPLPHSPRLCHHHPRAEPVTRPGLTTAGAGGFSCWDQLGQRRSCWRRAGKAELLRNAGTYGWWAPHWLQPYTAPDGICLAARGHDALLGEEERGPNARQRTDLHCTSIIPCTRPPPNAAARRVQSGQSSPPA